ncbi:MAG: hypothetical protein AAB706_01235 [Patescibacteria group bacterium]
MEKPNWALLFGNNADISLGERARVLNEINQIGSLTFKIYRNEEGWMAKCQEVNGIIAGGTNPQPTSVEIESQIRDAIFAAFDVKTNVDKESPYFTYQESEPEKLPSFSTITN